VHCVGNKSEIFHFKNDVVKMFGAYMQEANLKKNIYIIFNLFDYISVSCPTFA